MEKFNDNQMRFMLCSMAEMYYVDKTTKVELLEKDRTHMGTDVYYVKWQNTYVNTRYLTIEDIECVIECVKMYYGKTSKTYMEWTNIHGEILLRNKRGSI